MPTNIQTFPSLDDAIALAEFAHRNQRDQAGEPYIRHPMRVLRAVQEQGAAPYVQIAAVLHDVTEDTAYTPAMLLSLGVLPAAVDIIKLVDRDYSELLFLDSRPEWRAMSRSSQEYKDARDDFYYFYIRLNPGALQLKLADIGDNQLPWRVVYLPQAKQAYLREKYTKAIKLLTE
jgi:hypothetical protein